MYFESFSDVLTMGGHGPYVWTAYGITLLVILYLIWSPLAKKKRFFREQVQRARRDDYLQHHQQQRQQSSEISSQQES